MKYKDLDKKNLTELLEMDKKLREEIFHLRLKNRTAQLEKKHQIGLARRDVARIKTRMTQLKKQA